MKQSKCYTCEKQTHNLLTANCGHKICFNCVKNNKNTHKCSYCSLMSASRKKLIGGLSPAKKEKLEREKQRTTKTKSIESKKYEDASPFADKSTKKSQVHMQSCSNYIEHSTSQDPTRQVKLLCKQHHQPLTLFSKSTKQAICSTCLCSRPKFNQQIMPIKGAESFLRRENHLQRQQSRMILNEIEKCSKVMKTNHQQFQLYYGSHVKVLGEVFAQLHRELEIKERQVRERMDEFFVRKLRQCQEIEQDLSYLIQTLQTYRQQNKQSNTLTQSLYVYSSFKVIRKTMKTLNLDYVSYANKNVNLLEYNRHPFDSALVGLIRFDEDLPLKHEEVVERTKRRNRSASAQHQRGVSAKKEVNVYSNKKKGSIAYQHVLNEKIGLGPETYQQIFKRTQQSDTKPKHPSQTYSYQHLSRPKHINSLNAYVHQNLGEQKQKQLPKHSTSTYTYYNQQLSSSSFDYELKTPIKTIFNKDGKSLSGSGYKHIGESGNGESVSEQKKKQNEKSQKKKKNEFNVFSTGSVSSGLNMNQQERSLYKRLLKTRFAKNGVQTTNQQQVYTVPHDGHQNKQQQQEQYFRRQEESQQKRDQNEEGQVDEGYDDDNE